MEGNYAIFVLENKIKQIDKEMEDEEYNLNTAKQKVIASTSALLNLKKAHNELKKGLKKLR